MANIHPQRSENIDRKSRLFAGWATIIILQVVFIHATCDTNLVSTEVGRRLLELPYAVLKLLASFLQLGPLLQEGSFLKPCILKFLPAGIQARFHVS